MNMTQEEKEQIMQRIIDRAGSYIDLCASQLEEVGIASTAALVAAAMIVMVDESELTREEFLKRASQAYTIAEVAHTTPDDEGAPS
jgi:hypothetical protein